LHNKLPLSELFYKVITLIEKMNEIKSTLLKGLFIFVMVLIGFRGFSQETDDKTDSLYAARLMEVNLELYKQIDSLALVIKDYKVRNQIETRDVDSLQMVISQLQAQLNMTRTLADSLDVMRLRAKQDLLDIKQQMLVISTDLEAKLQLLREKEFQLNDCQIKLREAQSAASLNQARLEGRIDVNVTKVEAKDREIAYLQESIKEKDRIISEKSAELATYYRDKSNSLRVIDSLARTLNSRELELVKVTERLKIIESQYNAMLEQRTAAQNKKKKVRFVQGVGLKNYRTPDYQLAPQSSATTATYVITNKNAGNIEFDYITGVSLSLYDLSPPDGKYTYDAGLFVGFGGTNLFKNFYVSPSFKAFDFFHFMIGLNIAEYQQLQSGFNEGDELPPGMSIPTVKEWKANLFFGMTIDFELLSNIPKKM
jgi:hypothetical protein